MYEFVSKKEYGPFRTETEKIINHVQKLLKKEGITFQYRLVGSGKRHLITKIKNGNAGYDFDYNLILNNNYDWDPKIRNDIFNAFQIAINKTTFNKIENSTSVITIKKASGDKIIVGSDFSVICYPNDNSDSYKYIRYNKDEKQNFTWEIRSCSKNSDEKLKWLQHNYNNIWNEIRNEYLKLKNADKLNKHSFILYHEAVNNIFDQYSRQNEY